MCSVHHVALSGEYLVIITQGRFFVFTEKSDSFSCGRMGGGLGTIRNSVGACPDMLQKGCQANILVTMILSWLFALV